MCGTKSHTPCSLAEQSLAAPSPTIGDTSEEQYNLEQNVIKREITYDQLQSIDLILYIRLIFKLSHTWKSSELKFQAFSGILWRSYPQYAPIFTQRINDLIIIKLTQILLSCTSVCILGHTGTNGTIFANKVDRTQSFKNIENGYTCMHAFILFQASKANIKDLIAQDGGGGYILYRFLCP